MRILTKDFRLQEAAKTVLLFDSSSIIPQEMPQDKTCQQYHENTKVKAELIDRLT